MIDILLHSNKEYGRNILPLVCQDVSGLKELFFSVHSLVNSHESHGRGEK